MNLAEAQVNLTQLLPLLGYLLFVTVKIGGWSNKVALLEREVENLKKSHPEIGPLKIDLADVKATLKGMAENLTRLVDAHDEKAKSK